MQRGFTLIELLAVIVIISLIAVIAIPTVLGVINRAKKSAMDDDAKLILDTINREININPDFNPTDVTEDTIEDMLHIKADNYRDIVVSMVDGKPKIVITGKGKWEGLTAYGTYAGIEVVASEDYESEPGVIPDYVDSEGVNKPRLATGMTAIKWNGTTWENVSNPDTDTSWYDYANKEWANAKTEDGSMWVWIPRYAYQIATCYHTTCSGGAGTINIKFLKNNTNTTSDSTQIDTVPTYSGENQTNYILHPAFNFGGIQITGMWVAKFEPSVSNQSDLCYTTPSAANCNKTTLTPKIIPNAKAWVYQSVGIGFNVSRSMETNGAYGWGTSGNGIDTHMMKNSEWGAIAYLSKSSYGKGDEVWINPADNFTTGCAGDSVSSSVTTGCLRTYETTNGVKASTAGTIYGIYDMSGGCMEITMGNYGDVQSSGEIDPLTINNKYINRYPNGDWYGPTLGEAIFETSLYSGTTASWYTDYSVPPVAGPWPRRGGMSSGTTNSGIFYFNYSNGSPLNGHTFRPVILVYEEDTTPPVITISGNSAMKLVRGSRYEDDGATATDNVDGNLTANIQVVNNVNPNVVGTYTVTYNVTDNSENAAQIKTRTVQVIDVDSNDYIEDEGVNKPKLATGMTAIKWNSGTSTWDTVSNPDTDTTWYNYTNKEWANAKTADGSMWVWIPRYTYKIKSDWHSKSTYSEGGTISIQFSVGTDDTKAGTLTLDTGTTSNASNNKWTNHPAFTFGTTELTGIWVAKFEATAVEGVANGYTDGSCPNGGDNVTTKAVKIIPNVASWRCIQSSNSFTVSRNMETNSSYGWGTSGNNIDTHLIKNSEWGAVAYLSKSFYGKEAIEIAINPADNYTTGCSANGITSMPTVGCLNAYNTVNGVKASTTGTIYGIYDMRGGAYEQVSAYLNNGNANLNTYAASIVSANSKYKDIYTAAGTDTEIDNYPLTINKKGDAMYETSSGTDGATEWGWFNDETYMAYSNDPLFLRGGHMSGTSMAGIYNFVCTIGSPSSAIGFRPVLLVETGL